MQNDTPMTQIRPKSKPEIEFQYGGRPFSETGSSFISTVNMLWGRLLIVIELIMSVVDIIAPNCACIADSQEPAQRTTYVTREFLEFFMPAVQIELDPNEKDSVTHVYIRGPIRRSLLAFND